MKFDFSRIKFLNFITSPFFLALPVTILLAVFLLPNFQPYNMEIEEANFYEEEEETRRIYEDIDNDGIAEQLQLYNYSTFATIIAFLPTGGVYETWNLRGFWYESPDYEIADLNGNGIKEIYTLTINKGDSIFAGRLELEKNKDKQKYKFITRIKKYNNEYDFYMESLGIKDITGDSYPDFIFTIGAGFTRQPRGVYAWDIRNDSIIKTSFAGIMYKYSFFQEFRDIDRDSVPELFLTTVATDNYDSPVQYTDTSSYCVVLTKNLHYLFPPRQVSDRTSISTTLPIKDKNDYLVFCASILRRGKFERTEFKLLNKSGQEVKRKIKNNINSRSKYMSYNDKVLCTQVYNNETHIELIDENLQFKRITKFDEQLDLIGLIDKEKNSSEELILFNSVSDKLIIYNFERDRYAFVELPPKSLGFKGLSIIYSEGRQTGLLVETFNSYFRINLYKNLYFEIRFLFYTAYYIGTLILLLIIQRIFVYRNNRKKETQEKLINLQLQSIMNQLNPHFTFNAINSIGGAILTGKNEEAYEFFIKLSGLIRKSMKNAFHPYKTLEDEIEFVKEYLTIESYRFEEKLNWSITVAKDVDKTILIPKMLIHIFVENAIKHGIFHKQGKGNVNIDIRKEEEKIIITIDDDGIGIKEAIKINSKAGEGLKILNNYLHLFREIQHTVIKFEILSESENPERNGTRAIITIKPGR